MTVERILHFRGRQADRRRSRFATLACAILLVGSFLNPGASCHADGVINVHLDYKVILNPDNNSMPDEVTHAVIVAAVEDMNALSKSYRRGYRFVIDRIVDIGAGGAEPSRWYNIDFFDAPPGSSKGNLESAAEGNPALYQWVQNAINLYVTNGFCGGISSFPPTDEIVVIGGCSADNGPIQLHELGHYFDLCHSQGCPCGGCASNWTGACVCGGSSCVPADQFGFCSTWPADDNIDDTIEDLPCWDLDAISDWNFGVPYASLGTGNQARVDVAATNNMSYHHSRPLCNPIISMTEGQLDRMADALTLHTNRRHVRDGSTIFADPSGSYLGSGRSYSPISMIAPALTAANPSGGDVIILRPGAYPDTVTISIPVTLRPTRAGGVVLGASAAARRGTDEVHIATRTTIDFVEQLKSENPGRFQPTEGTCGTTRPE